MCDGPVKLLTLHIKLSLLKSVEIPHEGLKDESHSLRVSYNFAKPISAISELWK